MMSARDERELRGVEIDIIELVELHASSVDAHEFASAEYVVALSFQNFKNTWRTRAFSNVHLGKLQQQTYNAFVPSAYDAAVRFARTGTTLATRVTGAYTLYALYETQLVGPSVRIYICPPALDAMKALIAEAIDIGVHAVPKCMKALFDADAFVLGTRDVTKTALTRMGDAVAEETASKAEHDHSTLHEALEHLLHGDLSLEIESMRKSASEYTSALNVAANLKEQTAVAPVTICSTVDTLMQKTRTKVEKALEPPINAGDPLSLPVNDADKGAARKDNFASMPSFGGGSLQ